MPKATSTMIPRSMYLNSLPISRARCSSVFAHTNKRQFAACVKLRHASTTTTTATAGKEAARGIAKELKDEKLPPPPPPPKPTKRKISVLTWATLLAMGLGGYLYVTDTRASAHRWIVPPMIRWMYPDAEDAHHAGVDMLKLLSPFGLNPRERGNPDGSGELVTKVLGYTLCNPIGISGGLDKDAEVPSELFELGPAIVEVGGTTPFPQPGNPRPRMFRLPSQNAIINRYGLNSKGADHMAATLRQRVLEFASSEGLGTGKAAEQKVLNGQAGVPPGSLTEGKLLAVQIAKNKTTPDGDIEAIKKDYVYCVDRLAKYADILVVNVSSPNTPGLRDLQRVEPLTKILTGVVDAAKRTDRATKPFVMVKVSPDEDSDEQVNGICEAVYKSGVDGVIVGNTTNRRPKALPAGVPLPRREQTTLQETGGFSGPHLFHRTVSLVGKYREQLDQHGKPEPPRVDEESVASPDTGVIPPLPPSPEPEDIQPSKVIFASGGITNGEQALGAIKAGADVAMLYTGLVYGGVGTITRMKDEMRQLKRIEKD